MSPSPSRYSSAELGEDEVGAHQQELVLRRPDARLAQIGPEEEMPRVEQVEAIDRAEAKAPPLAGPDRRPVAPEERKTLGQRAARLGRHHALNLGDAIGRLRAGRAEDDRDVDVADQGSEAAVGKAAERVDRLDLVAENGLGRLHGVVDDLVCGSGDHGGSGGPLGVVVFDKRTCRSANYQPGH